MLTLVSVVFVIVQPEVDHREIFRLPFRNNLTSHSVLIPFPESDPRSILEATEQSHLPDHRRVDSFNLEEATRAITRQ